MEGVRTHGVQNKIFTGAGEFSCMIRFPIMGKIAVCCGKFMLDSGDLARAWQALYLT